MEEAEQIIEPAPERRAWLTAKRKILGGWIAWSLVMDVVQALLLRVVSQEMLLILFVIAAFGYGVLLLAWCRADSDERGEELSSGWKFMLVLLGFLTFIAYLFKTRGFVRGLLAIVYSLAFVIGVYILDIIVFTVVLIG
jgi:hypothetical protein